jgi:hypothetical protein
MVVVSLMCMAGLWGTDREASERFPVAFTGTIGKHKIA